MKRRRLVATLAVAIMGASFAACSQPLPPPVPRQVGSTKEAPGTGLPNLPALEKPDCSRGYVALTFDDGPSEWTDELLAILNYYDISATFFDLGQAELDYPRMVNKIGKAHHQFGNHTMTHPDLLKGPLSDAKGEIVDASKVHVQLGESAYKLFRPPYGSTNAELRTFIESKGMTEVLWTVDSKDYETPEPEKVVEQSKGMKDGGILLMHDGKPQTVRALPGVIANYYKEGMCFGQIAKGEKDQDTPIGIPMRARAVQPAKI